MAATRRYRALDMLDKEPFKQQGDPYLRHTLNGGELTAEGGLLQMTGGLPTAVYLALFGGNIDDDGLPKNPQSWWGNAEELDPDGTYRSETQHALETLPAIPANLRKIEAAVMRDLQWLLTRNIASVVRAEATMPALNTVKLVVTVSAEGVESNFEFVECWKAGGFEPVVLPLSPEWRVLENYYPRLTEDGELRLLEF